MNSFGNIFKVQVFGTSHGMGVGVIIDNIPAGLPLQIVDFDSDLKRRQGGNQKFTTPRKETDIPNIISGIYNGFTNGSPLMMLFENNNTRSDDYEKQKAFYRPGHADFVAHQKYNGFEDFRGGGHFSARITVGIVAAGVIAKKLLDHILIEAKVTAVGGATDIEAGLQKALAAKDSVGGIVSCKISNMPIGWGEPFWDSIESNLSHAMFSIPAVKGIEFGAGFKAAEMFGSQHNDVYINDIGGTIKNDAGGIIGGISNGNEINFNLAIKPTASTPYPQESYNNETQMIETLEVRGRHDLCVALRAPVIVEAMAAIVLADFKMLHLAKDNWKF